MLGYLVSGFVRLLVRLWTFGLFWFLGNPLFLWIKDIATPRLSYRKIAHFDEERNPRDHQRGLDSKLCSLAPSHNSWNSLFLSRLTNSRKLSFIWMAKTMFSPHPDQQLLCAKSCKFDKRIQAPWNLNIVSEAAIMQERNFQTDAMFEESFPVTPNESLLSYFNFTKKKEMGLTEHCSVKDFYHDAVQKEKDKIDLFTSDHTALSVGQQHCSSAGSIDSGYQSFPSVESTCTCIEEEGVTLYVSDCHYNKDGQLISMTVGFGITEESNSSNSLEFNDGVSDNESDLYDCESSDESEEDFITFDVGSACEDTDRCSFDGFVFKGTVDQIAVAMSVESCSSPMFEIRITHALPNSPTCFYEEKDCYRKEDEIYDKNSCANDEDDGKKCNSEIMSSNSGNSAGAVPKKKKVQFKVETEIHEMIAWDFAYRQARIGHWTNCATDRMQFQRRIDQIAKIIEPVLKKKLSQINH